MSLDQAKAFLAKVDEDAGLREQVRAAYSDQLVQVARQQGFDVSREDLDAAAREMAEMGEELSIAELEGAVGGMSGLNFETRRSSGLAADSIV